MDQRQVKTLVALVAACYGLGSKTAGAQNSWPPEAPTVEDLVKDQENLNLRGLVLPPFAGLPPNDPVKDVARSFNEGGRIVYLIRLLELGKNYSNWFFVFQDELSDVEATNDTTLIPPVATYGFASSNPYGYPQFSPDLHSLMFQSGDLIGSHGYFTPCFWNFAGKTIKYPAQTFVAYPEVRFSPDSQYIGFYFGGDRYGEGSEPQYAPHLYAQNIQSGKIFRISQQEGITSWDWTTKKTIVYSRELRQAPLPPDDTSDSVAFDSEVREHDLVSGADKPLIAHALQPSSSPDDRFIAFSRTVEVQDETPKTPDKIAPAPKRLMQSQLSLFDRQTKKTVALEAPAPMSQPTSERICTWSEDSKMLVVTRFIGTRTGKHCLIKTFQLGASLEDNPRARWKTAAEFDIETPNHILLTEVKKMTRNKRFLILNVGELVLGAPHSQPQTLETLEAVDLQNGQLRVLARKPFDWQGSLGWDWIELPLEAPLSSSKP